jgi:transcriptional regulatory protein RtcR
MAAGGRITVQQVDAEIAHLRAEWSAGVGSAAGPGLVDAVLSAKERAGLDRFDRVQLEDVLGVCQTAANLSAAGRVLFSQSRRTKKSTNDADRLRKYLARFGLDWGDLKERLRGEMGPRSIGTAS